MDNEILRNISKIIERDSKVSTYKFALLRGIIDIIKENSPYIAFRGDRVVFPTGLLIEKWILYYYPIFQSEITIPQIYGSTNKIAFYRELKELVSYYELKGGYSAFYNDIRNKGIPQEFQPDFHALCRKIGDTVCKMPMKYIGRSLTDEFYSIFRVETRRTNRRALRNDLEDLISVYGTFSIPRAYYDAFQVIGSFVSGQDSILFKWAEFSVSASGNELSVDRVIDEVLKSPITSRDITESKRLYRDMLEKHGKVYCVWTGKRISRYDIDHLIPFSIWKNNDLWNLLPSQSTINNQKRDKIPSPELIGKSKELIGYYWNLINQYQPIRFNREIRVALLGDRQEDEWQEAALKQLQDSAGFLIGVRGYEAWDL